MTKYLHLLISGLMGVTAINGCVKSTSLEEQLLGGKMEILPSGFIASHNVKEGKVKDSILSGNGMYVLFKDLDYDGKLGLNDYCSVNEIKSCDESPAWGVPQSNNPNKCSVNVCATHYPSTLSSLHPTKVRSQFSPENVMQVYTTAEMLDKSKIAPLFPEQIADCPKMCRVYFRGSNVLPVTIKIEYSHTAFVE